MGNISREMRTTEKSPNGKSRAEKSNMRSEQFTGRVH